MTEFTMSRESLEGLLSWLNFSEGRSFEELITRIDVDFSDTAIRSFHEHGLTREDVMEILEHLESSSEDSWIIQLQQDSLSWEVIPSPKPMVSPVQTVEEVVESALKDAKAYEKRIEELETELDWTRESYADAETAFWECFEEGVKAEEAMQGTIESLENNLNISQASVSKLSEEYADLHKQYVRREDNLTEAREARKEWRELAQESLKENNGLKVELEKLKVELFTAHEDNESAVKSILFWMDEAEGWEEQFKESLKETAGLSNEVGRLKETCKGWDSLYEDCLDERIELEQDKEGLAAELGSMQRACDGWISKYDQMEELWENSLDANYKLAQKLHEMQAAVGTAPQEPTQTELFNAAEYADKQPLTVSIKVDGESLANTISEAIQKTALGCSGSFQKDAEEDSPKPYKMTLEVDGKVLAQHISKDTPLKSAAEVYDTAGPTSLEEIISPEVMQAYFNKVILPSFRWLIPPTL